MEVTTTLTSEKVFTRDKLVEASTLIDFRFEFLAMLLDGKSISKAAEVREEKAFLIQLFKQVDKILKIDRRGIHAAKPDLVRASIKDLYSLLSESDKAGLLKELQEEQSHVTTHTR